VPEARKSEFSDLTFRSAILDSLVANIAVIDSNGEIVAVNARWQEFAIANQMHNSNMGVGTNYLAVCRSARADPNARAALDGILDVMKGYQPFFYHEYPCHSPSVQRWFALRAAPLIDYPNFVVVSHEEISDRMSRAAAAQPREEE
jgi:PAS domain-containing protein